MSDIPRRFAAIDCGTNTFTMLVVDVASELAAEGGGRLRWRECFRLRLPVRLGEGGFKAGQIAPDRFARGLDALGVLRECARNLGVSEIKVVGTSALRGAANGADFAAAVQRRLGWDLRIIDGLEEARLIHVGASAAYVPAPGGRVLTLDIGGGASRPLCGRIGRCRWGRSVRTRAWAASRPSRPPATPWASSAPSVWPPSSPM